MPSISAPELVLSQSEAEVASKVRRVQRLFCRSQALGGVDIDERLPDSSPHHRATGQGQGQGSKDKGKSNGKDRGKERDIDSDRDSGSSQRPVSLKAAVRAAAPPEMRERDEGEGQEDGDDERDPSVQRGMESKLDVSRIVLGNSEMISDKFPYFIHRLNMWIEVRISSSDKLPYPALT